MSEYIYTTEGAFGLRECTGEEIVRCRDCIRYSLDDYGNTWCAYVASAVQPDDFCSWGTPKNSETTPKVVS